MMQAPQGDGAPEASQLSNNAPAKPSAPSKPIHTLVIDTGPLIKNDPPVSSLLAQAHELCTLPSVLSEIRDAATRSRVEATLLPFLKLRSPKPESIKFVVDFARRTGDLEVLSKPDLHLIALTYELECERNGGDWRLRKEPGQKALNGQPPAQLERPKSVAGCEDGQEAQSPQRFETTGHGELENAESYSGEAHDENKDRETDAAEQLQQPKHLPQEPDAKEDVPSVQQEVVTHELQSLSMDPTAVTSPPAIDMPQDTATPTNEDDDDEGWITPANLKQHQAKDQLSAPEQPIRKVLQVALLTSDYAMQNVLLRINLNLVSPRLARITRVKTWVLRCHGCFQITRNMSKQFCPRCGQPTLTRVSCSTDQNGNFQIYLKKNFQYNNRGNVYSVPKPVHGTANGSMRGPGGGKNGWGRELILAEDQKEYTRKLDDQRRTRQKDLMDQDYLPGILSGERSGGHGRIRIGAGRSVNSKKRNK